MAANNLFLSGLQLRCILVAVEVEVEVAVEVAVEVEVEVEVEVASSLSAQKNEQEVSNVYALTQILNNRTRITYKSSSFVQQRQLQYLLVAAQL